LENLQESIQQESGALKQLVTGDFDRFVRCKNGIDEVYERMVEGGFNNKDEYGTAKIKKTLDGILDTFWRLTVRIDRQGAGTVQSSPR
jgi:hypothetical protein